MNTRVLKLFRFRDNHLRFPEHDRANSEVRTYYLTPEELEKYRALPKPKGKPPIAHWSFETRRRIQDHIKKVRPEDFTKEQYLKLKKLGFSDKVIRNWLGTHHVWMLEKKREWGLVGYRVKDDDKK